MRRLSRFAVCFSAAIAVLSRVPISFASEQGALFQRSLVTSISEPVILDVAVSGGSVTIGYSRDDEVNIHAFGKDAGGKDLPAQFFQSKLLIEQKQNSVSIREVPGLGSLFASLYSIDYRIDVPYRTEVDSTVFGTGNQTLVGVYGPAKLVSGAGDIDAQYVRFALLEAKTGKGNISCSRCFAVNAETGAGNITLLEDGDSKALVKSGRGRIDIGGARGAVDASTQAGMLHVKAVLSDDWQLESVSGNIRVELPPKAKFE